MKVLVVHNAYQSHHVGGEDVVVSREIEALQTLLGKDQVFEYYVSNDQIRLVKLAKTIWGDKYHRQQIFHLVKEHQIDIVHVHNFFPLLTPSVFAGAKAAGAKVVHTLHNFRWWCLSGILYRKEVGHCEMCVNKKFAWPGIFYRCYRHSWIQSLVAALAFFWYRIKQSQKNIDAYFVLSHSQQEKLKNLIPANKLLLKPDGITFLTTVQREVSQKKGYLFVGRLEAPKGVECLLATWQKLPSHFQLTLIGNGEDFALLQKRYTQENIHFLGKLSPNEVLAHMSQAKYLVHPSLMVETFGLTMIEAMSVGTPVIGFDRGTRKEFISSGKNGFLCQPDTLQQTIETSYDYSGYEALSREARQFAQAFALPEVIQKQVALYQRLLDDA
ncbi:MAG: glycosyltransferase family 4 protein [Candidatus Berkiellales bacterium]